MILLNQTRLRLLHQITLQNVPEGCNLPIHECDNLIRHNAANFCNTFLRINLSVPISLCGSVQFHVGFDTQPTT
jgi:hypothetical protein